MIVKFDSIEEGENQGLRVLEMQEGSPAFLAGLVPYKDYIIGSGDIIIRHSDDLSQILEDNTGALLTLNVYNSETESIREVELTPNREWGGNGLLGCGIGTGVLHRIPMGRLSPVIPSVPAPVLASKPGIITENTSDQANEVKEPVNSDPVIHADPEVSKHVNPKADTTVDLSAPSTEPEVSGPVLSESTEARDPERSHSNESVVIVEKQDISSLFP